MQVVIDIPDEWRARIEYNRRPNTIECGELVESIWRGKILPKHGRLIDADKAIGDILTVPQQYEELADWCCQVIAGQLTVIEANTE